MDDEDAFTVMGGSLKLKVATKKDKKKSKKDKKKDKKKRKLVEVEPAARADELEPVDQITMTAAEQRHLERKRVADEKRLDQLASKTHRERINDYNAYLASLSEIHDIPKVGPG